MAAAKEDSKDPAPGASESSEKTAETMSEPSSQAAPADGGQKAEEAESEKKNQQAKAEGRRGLKERLPAFLELIRDRDNQELVKHGFSRLGKILRSLRPRFLRAQALVGLGEPDLTGYAYGIYWAVKPFLGKKCQAAITPDFERRVIEGEIVLGGRVMAAVVLHHVVRVLLDRRLRRLIDRLKTI